jgi:hypothetical protein
VKQAPLLRQGIVAVRVPDENLSTECVRVGHPLKSNGGHDANQCVVDPCLVRTFPLHPPRKSDMG